MHAYTPSFVAEPGVSGAVSYDLCLPDRDGGGWVFRRWFALSVFAFPSLTSLLVRLKVLAV